MLLAQIAQTAFHFVSEHYLIILLSFLLLFLAYRRQEIEGRIGLLLILLFALFSYYYYWRNLCRNQVNVEKNTVITFTQLDEESINTLHHNGFHIIKKCETNPLLLLWSTDSSDVSIEGSDGLADGGDGKVKGGEGGNQPDVDVSRNLRIFIPEPFVNSIKFDSVFGIKAISPVPGDSPDSTKYLIANTDSGIDGVYSRRSITSTFGNLWTQYSNTFERSFSTGTEQISTSYISGIPVDIEQIIAMQIQPNPSILPDILKNSKRGWSFVENNNNIIQNNSHGTNTTYLFERELTETPHKFIPLVVLKIDNTGYLFDALCAFEYAIAFNKYSKSDKIRVINASWGYYGFENAALKYVIDRLKDNKILLVAAAGNSNAECDKCEELEKNNLRNLSVRRKKFYPASYSNVCDNLISVTTVNVNGDIYQAENQNYSDEYVDLGVQSDNYRTGDFLFKLPNQPKPVFSWGTSYAAPIATSQLFKKINKPSPVINKTILLRKEVESISPIALQSGNAAPVVNGNYRIESTWRATNLTKNGKVLLKKY